MARHPKLRDLAAELGRPLPFAAGAMLGVWGWVADFAPEGVISGREVARTVEDAAGWDGRRGRFYAAAVAVGLLDEKGPNEVQVHGWGWRNGAIYQKFLRDRERVGPQGIRKESARTPQGIRTDSARNPRATDVTDGRTDGQNSLAPVGASSACADAGAHDAARQEPAARTDSDKSTLVLTPTDGDKSTSDSAAAPKKAARTRKKPPPDPEKTAEAMALRADADAFLAAHRRLFASPRASYGDKGFFVYKAQRAKHGAAQLLAWMEAVASDEWARTHFDFAWCLSDRMPERGAKTLAGGGPVAGGTPALISVSGESPHPPDWIEDVDWPGAWIPPDAPASRFTKGLDGCRRSHARARELREARS